MASWGEMLRSGGNSNPTTQIPCACEQFLEVDLGSYSFDLWYYGVQMVVSSIESLFAIKGRKSSLL